MNKFFNAIAHPKILMDFLKYTINPKPVVLLPCGYSMGGFASFSEYLCAKDLLMEADTAFLKNNPFEGVVLDVGANLGAFSLELVAHNRNTRVFAFEPASATYRGLCNNIRNNKAEEIIPIEQGVADVVGTVSFSTGRLSFLNRIIYDPDDKSGTIEVRITTVDRFLQDNSIGHVSLLKIDVEGVEEKVLRGAEISIRAGIIDKIFIEVCPSNMKAYGLSVDSLYATVEDMGLDFREILPDGSIGRCRFVDDLRVVRLENFILIPR